LDLSHQILIGRLKGDQIYDTIDTIANSEDLIPVGRGCGLSWPWCGLVGSKQNEETSAKLNHHRRNLRRTSSSCKEINFARHLQTHLLHNFSLSLSFYNKKAMGELHTPRLAIIMDDTNM
jgi:hypothetical protein